MDVFGLSVTVYFYMRLATHSGVCATHILVINTQARLLTEKHFSCQFIFTEVCINKLETLPFHPFRYILAFLILLEGFVILARRKKCHAPQTGWLHMTYKVF
jgi:hypothetical protein